MHKDLKFLQGSWKVKSLKLEGQSMAAAMLEGARIEVKGERFTSTGMGADYAGTLELDAAATPSQIDMKFDSGPEKGNINLGVYELGEASWKLCLATRGTVRPTKFASPAGSGFALETLVRADAPAAKKKAARVVEAAQAGPATEFEGEWSMVSAVMDGKPLEESMVSWVKRVTHGNQMKVLVGPQTMLNVTFTHQPAQSSIDYLVVSGPDKGETQLGIYEFEGELLTFCMAPPGGERPKDFTSVAGDKRTLSAWKRK